MDILKLICNLFLPEKNNSKALNQSRIQVFKWNIFSGRGFRWWYGRCGHLRSITVCSLWKLKKYTQIKLLHSSVLEVKFNTQTYLIDSVSRNYRFASKNCIIRFITHFSPLRDKRLPWYNLATDDVQTDCTNGHGYNPHFPQE